MPFLDPVLKFFIIRESMSRLLPFSTVSVCRVLKWNLGVTNCFGFGSFLNEVAVFASCLL